MKKQKQIIRLGGEDFTLQNKILTFDEVINYSYKDINNCYKNCSSTKCYIYKKYGELLHNNCDYVRRYGIRSYSHHIITLHSIVIINDNYYYVDITPSKNIIYKVVL